MAFDRDLRDLLRATKALASSPAENIERQLEGDLQRLERHIHEAEERVANQRQVVEQRRTRGESSELAEQLLQSFEEALANHCHLLAKLREFRSKR